MRIIFFDTETTGDVSSNYLCQIAVKERGVAAPIANATYKPPSPISIMAMAIHHITEKMVAERPAFATSPEYKGLKELFEHPETIAVAHNAAFDLGVVALENIRPARYICTYKVARAIDTDEKFGKYNLQYLRYLLGLEIEATAHDAWGDVLVLEGVFEHLLARMLEKTGSEEAALNEMIAISEKPMLYTTIRFGKHSGKRLEDIVKSDRGYLEWLLKEKKKDPADEGDWIYTLEHYLKEAKAGAAAAPEDAIPF